MPISTIANGSTTARDTINEVIVKINNDLKDEAAILAIINGLRASLEEAEEGTSNGVLMTPVRTKQAFSALFPTAVASLTKADVGLGNVDNTSDANKPVSTAVQAALDAALAGFSNVDNTSDLNKPVSTAAQAALDAAIAALTKSDVGLGNVDNTSDANKPISTAVQAVFDLITEQFTELGESGAEVASQAFEMPGLMPAFSITSTLYGKAATLPPLAIGAVATSDEYGTVWEVEGADFSGAYLDVLRKQDFYLLPGRIYRIRMILERAVDPIDPLSDGIEVRIALMAKAHGGLNSVVIGSAYEVTVAGGALDVSFTLSRDPPEGISVDYEVPSQTRYFRPQFRIYGGAPQVTRIAMMDVEDVSVAEEVRQRVALLETIGIENLALSQSEAEVGETVAPTVTWDLAGTAPVAGVAIQVGGGGPITLASDAESYAAPNAMADTTYTVSVQNDTTDEISSAAVTLDFKNRVYWGASASTSLDSAGVVGLAGSALAGARQRSITAAATAEYVFYAYPASFGAPSDYRMFGFSTVPVATTVSVTTGAGATLNYIVLRSPEPLTDTDVAIEVL